MKSLDDFPRIELAALPTPFRKLENISRLTGKNVYIKRDDMTGVALGGNKVRKLEYLLADAKQKGCDVVLTTGGAQSNHAMLTAACCRRVGLDVILVLKARGVMGMKGNLLLNDLMDVDVRFVDSDTYDDVYAEMYSVADKLEKEGHKPYLVPVGGSVPLGSLGYVRCMQEVAEQAKAMGVHVDHVVCCAGSGGTHAGTALGAKLFMGAKTTGIAVCDDPFDSIVLELMEGTKALLEADVDVSPADVTVKPYWGEGYAIPSAEGVAAIRTMAKSEGIVLDPVYTGKTFAGLLDLCEKGYFDGDENIVFVHTGGAAALFAIDVEHV